MGDLRHGLSWLLLAMVGAVTVGAAAIGVIQSPNNASLGDAVKSTLGASGYNEVATDNTTMGNETFYLTFNAPDRLGGFVQSGNRRSYVYIIGNVEYQSLTVSPSASTKHLTFYRQPSAGARRADPVQSYLPLYSQGKNPQLSGGTTTMTASLQGQTVDLVYTVSGKYVAQFKGSGQGQTVGLTISQVGNAPAVKLPSGAKVLNLPGSGVSG